MYKLSTGALPFQIMNPVATRDSLSISGSHPAVFLRDSSSGSAAIRIFGNSSAFSIGFDFSGGESYAAPAFEARSVDLAVNSVRVTGAVAGTAPQIRAISSADTYLRIHGTGSQGVLLADSGQTVGFFGTLPQPKPTITGSRGANAALANLLNALAAMGLITNSTTT